MTNDRLVPRVAVARMSLPFRITFLALVGCLLLLRIERIGAGESPSLRLG